MSADWMADPAPEGTAQFIVPIGIDMGRVKSGIQHWFSKRQIPTIICLPISKEWADDQEYQKRVLKPIQRWLKGIKESGHFPYDAEFPKVENIDEFESGFAFQVKEMIRFRRMDPHSNIYVDTTSAPKTWLIAAMRVIDIFPRVIIYHVKSTMKPASYSNPQVEDPGGETKTFDVRSGGKPVLAGLVSGEGIYHELLVACHKQNSTLKSPARTKEFVDGIVEKFPRYKNKDAKAVRQAVTDAFKELEQAD